MPVRCCAVLSAIVILAGSARGAGTMLQPASVSTGMGFFQPGFEPVNAINQTGLSAGYTSGVTDFTSFAATTNTVLGNGAGRAWFSTAGVTTGNFDFDLGGLNLISAFVLWNEPNVIHQGVNDFQLLADITPAFSSPVLLGTFNAVDGLGNANNFGQTFIFAPTPAVYVRMVILSNHGSTTTTGFTEAAFGTGVIPAPPTLALGALGLLGLKRRRGR
jgi:hypothetical protein